MKRFPLAVLIIGAVLGFATIRAQQMPSPGPHPHGQMPPQSWMTEYGQMMAEMKAGDVKLQSLADRMMSAAGDEKVPAIQDVVSELVQEQLATHRHMMRMHDQMMSQVPMK
jgi:hypothetical protein